ncbi:DUF2007 domain-containing protein [Thiorhodococcus mannitoliphagus]|uniref:DUF2007 domain-containing protein n=1 Tax=Thiorhodococcus mannitoliphagus TaxID=329406 RepID=A0A6P1DVH4_9GAMM|nr:DUF2007 domain-containing protein [Thiorhodococcus mannitoliphagus]NEX21480.1 DUF2007 domain-containing protein [Thiorhodococcus mannitoliphagus]
MQQLYQAQDRIEAQILHDFLDRHLIETVILGDYLSGAVGELPADIYPSLWLIHDDDLERGRELLHRFLQDANQRVAQGAWTCSSCGETVSESFDLCWRCGQARPTPE